MAKVTKYHVNEKGEAHPCTASKRGCKFSHFDNYSEALAAAERVFAEKYANVLQGVPASGVRRAVQNADILQGAFAKLDSSVTFTELPSRGNINMMSARGKEVDYMIKTTGNGRSFVYYKRQGVEIRPSSFHDNLDEAQSAVNSFESNW